MLPDLKTVIELQQTDTAIGELTSQIEALPSEAQALEADLDQSRKAIAQRFRLDEGQVREIEREGIDNNWPPL